VNGSSESHIPSSILRLLTILLYGWCGLYALLFLHHGMRLAQYPFDVDNSEAYLVYQGMRLANGESLYLPLEEPPYLVDNYPPLYSLLLATGFHFFEPNFHWPRYLSLLSTCLTAGWIGFWIALLVQRWSAGLLGALVFLSFYHVYDWGALGRVDAVGIFFSIAGLALFEKTNSWKRALPFFVLALSTRQTLFAAPLAVFFVLFSRNRKTAYSFLALLAGIGIVVLGLLILLSHGRAFAHLILYNANTYRFSDLWIYTFHWISTYTVWGVVPLLILVAGWNVGIGKKEERAGGVSALLFWFTMFAIGEAGLCGKIGSAPNYLLSLVAATSVGIGFLYNSFVEHAEKNNSVDHRQASAPLLFFLLVSLFQLGATLHWPLNRIAWSRTPTREAEAVATLVKNELRRVEGAILSDLAGIPLMAGHPPVLDPFICTQLAQQGLWDQTPLLKRVQSREFPRILLHFDLFAPNWDRERFTTEMIEGIRSRYQLKRRYDSPLMNYFLYEPIP